MDDDDVVGVSSPQFFGAVPFFGALDFCAFAFHCLSVRTNQSTPFDDFVLDARRPRAARLASFPPTTHQSPTPVRHPRDSALLWSAAARAPAAARRPPLVSRPPFGDAWKDQDLCPARGSSALVRSVKVSVDRRTGLAGSVRASIVWRRRRRSRHPRRKPPFPPSLLLRLVPPLCDSPSSPFRFSKINTMALSSKVRNQWPARAS